MEGEEKFVQIRSSKTIYETSYSRVGGEKQRLRVFMYLFMAGILVTIVIGSVLMELNKASVFSAVPAFSPLAGRAGVRKMPMLSRLGVIHDTVQSDYTQMGTIVYPSEDVQPTDERVAFNYLMLLILVIACYLTAYAIREAEFRYLHESGAAIFIGMLVGGAVRYLGELERLQDVVSFNSDLFFFVLLPPIIFDAGYGLKSVTFFHNFYSIMWYAFVGTLIVAFSFGGLVYLVCLTPLVREDAQLSLIEAMLYGSMISATDPVTTLAIFADLRVPKVLYSNVFGESVFNDAVAIVLYRTVDIFRVYPVTAQTFLYAGVDFCVIFIGSVVVGLVVGFALSLVYTYTEFKKFPNFEISVMLLSAYASYLLAEGLGLSGIVAILFAGIVMASYATRAMSQKAHHASDYIFNVIASTSEMIVFVYIGLSVFSLEAQLYDLGLISASFVAMLLTRSFNVFPITFIINMYRRKFKPAGHEEISFPIQLIMFWAGLRGAIAFSLSLEIETPHADFIRSSTMFLVLSSIVLIGGTTFPLLRYLEVPMGEPWMDDEPVPRVWRSMDNLLSRRIFKSSQNTTDTDDEPIENDDRGDKEDSVELDQDAEQFDSAVHSPDESK